MWVFKLKSSYLEEKDNFAIYYVPFTSHYVFALGVARFLSCAHWVLQVLDTHGDLLVALGYGLWQSMTTFQSLGLAKGKQGYIYTKEDYAGEAVKFFDWDANESLIYLYGEYLELVDYITGDGVIVAVFQVSYPIIVPGIFDVDRDCEYDPDCN
ncbi:hypothetical protein RJT34_01478 [Clitoria ternatea]|uniref:Uncharacterized protein n=1 Tax=Clitoria ternatea TaxID=43366 RepID=A0AAN9KI68_CLITE